MPADYRDPRFHLSVNPNTPIKTKPAHTAAFKMNARDVRRIVKSELDEGNLHVTSTNDFLERLLPVDADLITKVYKALIVDRTYNAKSKRWPGLAQARGGKEDAIYAPFVKTAEHITGIAFKLVPSTPLFRTKWVDRHNEAPSSIIPESAILRPDLINILQSEAEDVEAEVKKATTDEGKKEIIKAWWHRVNSVTEVKTKKKVEEHVYQLLVYMRQMLAEQLDRRFVFGTLFCDSDLTIWLADRTGVLGTETAINIHAEPKDFIRIILAMSLLPPEKLGWDMTMRICKQPIEVTNIEAVHSFDPSVKLSDYNDSASKINWAIDMPAKDDPTKRETFIAVRALDITRAASMSGRATIIWAMLKQADLSKPPSLRKIHVLKQTWRPLTATPEGEFYPKDGTDGHDLVYSYEDVKVNGVTVDTFKFIRQSVGSVTHPPEEKVEVGKKRKTEESESVAPHLESLAEHLDIVTTDSTQYMHAMHHNAPTFRVQSRMLMAFYGWPLRNFKDLLELLQVLKDAIEFHKKIYFTHLVLHRDISLNNILIYPDEDSGEIEGRLIDYDYAKKTPDRKKSLLSHSQENGMPYRAAYAKLELENILGVFANGDIIFEVIASCIKEFRTMAECLNETWHIQQKKENKAPILHSDLGFLNRGAELPDFSTCQAQTAKRSATFPYASPEVLQGEGMWVLHSPHDARHDMESFFWILTEICISRSGPGGVRRKELDEPYSPTSPNAAIHRVYYCVFRSDDRSTLITNKTGLFRRDDFENFVLCHVHPYFERLKPLLLRWWRILMLVHQYPHIETVHDFFLDALNDTIKDLEKQPPEPHPDTKEVVKRRQENLNMLRTLGSDDKAASQVKWSQSPGAEIVPANTDYGGRISSKPFEEPESPTRRTKRSKTNN